MTHRKLQGTEQSSRLGHRGVAEVVKPPLAAGTHIVGCDDAAAGALSAAGASYPCRYRRVAKPWTEEPDAGNLHVRIRGSLGGASP